MKKIKMEIYEEYAEMLKVMAHPIRLLILKHLSQNGDLNVSNIQELVGIPQPTVSSHLAKLKRSKVLKSRRVGTEIYYMIDSPKAKEIIKILFGE